MAISFHLPCSIFDPILILQVQRIRIFMKILRFYNLLGVEFRKIRSYYIYNTM